MARVQQKVRGESAELADEGRARLLIIGGLFLVLLLVLALIAFVGMGRGPQTANVEGVQVEGRVIGSPDAPVVIREFADFQCSHCRDAASTLVPQLIENYVKSGDVRLEIVPVALVSTASVATAEAALCAEEQGRFWAYHDELFANQGRLQADVPGLATLADEVGLDVQAFRTCLGSGKYRNQVQANTEEMGRLGGEGTPYFIVGNVPVAGAVPFEQMQPVIEAQLGQQGE